MKSVKLPYPVSFQELLKLSVQPIQSRPSPRNGKKETPKPQKKTK